MTGLGILIAFFVFVGAIRYYAKKKNLSFMSFFYAIPLLIISCYLLWSYVFFILSQWSLFPTNGQELLMLFSPYNQDAHYTFHYVGVALWFLLFVLIFLKRFPHLVTRRKRIDALFFALVLSLIPLWFFLLLGDDFIGKENMGRLAVYPFHPWSNVVKYGKVYPLWLFVSVVAFLSLVIVSIIRIFKKRPGSWYIWFAILLLWMSVVFLYQQYSMHGVIKIGEWLRFDIKHYVSWWIAFLSLFLYHQSLQSVQSKKL